MRLIDANSIPWEEYYVPDPDSNAQWDYKKERSVLKPVVDQMPTVDAVEVVRCKDCKWGTTPYGDEHDGWTECINIHGRPLFRDDGFCSYGERRDNGED